jgi:large subunit ribosomal protein L9
MEILLLQDIVGVGKKNDLIQVGDGFALNHLLPRRAALVATPLVRRRYAELIRKRAEEREIERQSQAGTAKALSGKTITIKRKATKTGKLYAGVTAAIIAEALKDQHGIGVPEAAIQLSEPIKSLGSTSIGVILAGQTLPVTVVVEAEAA